MGGEEQTRRKEVEDEGGGSGVLRDTGSLAACATVKTLAFLPNKQGVIRGGLLTRLLF